MEEGGGGRRWRRGEGLEAHVYIVVGTQANFNRFDDWSTDLECLHYLVKLAVVQVPWTKDVFLHIPAQFPW